MFNKNIDLSSMSLLRLYICVETLAVVVFCGMDSRSFLYAITATVVPIGQYLLYLMSALAAIGALDSVINDIMGERFTFKYALEIRTINFMTQALCFGALMFLAVKMSAWNILPFFIVNVAALVGTTYADIAYRVKPRTGERRKGERRHA